MALSVQQTFGGPVWPLGCVVVTTPGTPVCIMHNVDANNNNAPGTAVGPGTAAAMGTTPTFHKIFFQGYHPGANNNGMVINSGNVYLLVAGAQGPGNRSDSGAMVFVIPPGGTGTWPSSEVERDAVQPYQFFVDADSANDGLLTVGQI